MRRALSFVRRAVDDYNMINDGDRIAVGVSGGKDSITLALALNALKRFYPKKFEVVPITLDMGFKDADFEPLRQMFAQHGMELIVKKTDIAEILFDIRKEKNPCSLCAKMRRGALHDAAIENGCRKVALGHHRDDVIETFFLCLFYEGRISCFNPVTYLDRKDVHVIRPLIYMSESDVRGFVARNTVTIVKNPCPADGNTKRQYVKDLITSLTKENHGLKERLFTAVQGLDAWKIKEDTQDES
ncbi:MAG: tRNA 2-thiocytidine(32) synthetase TtcA [Clostridia bacterium]|nr:tRNA 2-thiocytidine(32) synthetase TtcA [Clostridia bacterium]